MSWYREYLDSDSWKHLRLKKLKTTKLCFICGNVPDVANIHHVRYKNVIDVSTQDLRVACQECHEVYHAVKNESHPSRPESKILKQTREIVRAMQPI